MPSSIRGAFLKLSYLSRVSMGLGVNPAGPALARWLMRGRAMLTRVCGLTRATP